MMIKGLLKKNNSGVTLVELVVVIFIFVVISGITVFNYGQFKSSLSIQNLSDDIALSVRRAQGFAIGVRGLSGSFDTAYGVHFTTNKNSLIYKGSNKSFVLFVDVDGDKQYDNYSNTCGSPTSGDECLELLSITSTDQIDSIYLNSETKAISSVDTLDMIFKRPNPEPSFCYRVGGIGSCSTKIISSIKIRISTEADPSIYRTINISNNGQVSVFGTI